MRGQERIERRELAAMAHASSDTVITANGVPLELVDVFRYLGRPIAGNNNDWPAVFHNLGESPSTLGHAGTGADQDWSQAPHCGTCSTR